MDEEQLESYLHVHQPSCLATVKAVPSCLPKSVDQQTVTAWNIVCRCECETGRFLGYPLKDYNREYDGPIFVSPLLFQCQHCQNEAIILDTDRDGYHAALERFEQGNTGSATIRGRGKPSQHRCPSCQNSVFEITVGFVYWYLDELAEEFTEQWEELFNEFLCHCRCTQCGHVSGPTGFGKL